MNKDNTKLPNGWIFVPGLVFAVLLLFYIGSMSNDWFNPRGRGLLAIALILAVPSVVGLISRICRWQVTRLLAVGTVASYWVWVGVLTIESFSSIYGLMFFGIVLVLMFVVAIVTTGLLGFKMGRSWVLAAVGGLFLGMIATSHSIERARDKNQWHGADTFGLSRDMVTIDKCAHQFAAIRPASGYPQSLEQLGSHGSGCLSGDLKDRYPEFSFVYRPGDKDSQGKVTTYTMKAEQLSPHGPDFSSIFTDDSGLVLFSQRGPHGTRFPRVVSRVDRDIYFLLAACLHGQSEVFRVRADPEATDRAFQRCAPQYLREYILGSDTFVSPWSRITYKFERNDEGAVERFIADVRPNKYGDPAGGIRGYLIEVKFSEQGAAVKMYGTPEDRPAKTSDPLAEDCEQEEPGDCKPFEEKVK